MSHKSTVALFILLSVLVAFNVAEFFTAPQSIQGWVKMQIGMQIVKHDLQKTFDHEGRWAANKLCSQPIKRLGYYYTIYLLDGKELNCDGSFYTVEAGISAHYTPYEANLELGVDYFNQNEPRAKALKFSSSTDHLAYRHLRLAQTRI